jgi:quercetin dioxygenase-like cupin family protein
MMKRTVLLCCVLALASAMALAQDAAVVTPPEQKFMNFPGLPTCVKGAVLHGDPMGDKGAVLMLKSTAGCLIPWHWHTSTEQLGFVSGSGKLEMKGGPAKTLTPGSYVYLPSKHQHQFTCPTACTLFLATDAKFDIHYVDASGNEIPPDQALKSGKSAGAAKGKAAPKK